MRFGSVCSGIEAASCAWHPIGWKAAFVSEIEKFPSAVLAHHYPDTPNLGDMTKFKDWPDAAIDLLVGGTPCQSFSVAGLRKGLADPRGNLMLTYLAIADRYRPRWLVWENVPGVLSSGGGRDFGTFLGGLAELGYGFAYRVLDAQYAGVPQRRRRVFVVGHLGDWRRAAAVLFERHSLQGHPAPRYEARQEVAGALGAGSKRRGQRVGRREAAAGQLIPMPHADLCPAIKARDSKGVSSDGDGDGDGAILVPMVAGTLQNSGRAAGSATQQDAEAGLLIAHSLRAEEFDASEDGTGRGTPLVPVPFDTTQITSAANYSNTKPGDPCHPLAAGAHAPAVAFDWQSGGDARGLGPKPTVQLQRSQTPATLQAMKVRRLTPIECARLQGFPDDYLDIVYRGKPAADGPKYKALGNSMAVPVMRWIGQRIQMVEEISETEVRYA